MVMKNELLTKKAELLDLVSEAEKQHTQHTIDLFNESFDFSGVDVRVNVTRERVEFYTGDNRWSFVDASFYQPFGGEKTRFVVSVNSFRDHENFEKLILAGKIAEVVIASKDNFITQLDEVRKAFRESIKPIWSQVHEIDKVLIEIKNKEQNEAIEKKFEQLTTEGLEFESPIRVATSAKEYLHNVIKLKAFKVKPNQKTWDLEFTTRWGGETYEGVRNGVRENLIQDLITNLAK
jgi:hypothetical protein